MGTDDLFHKRRERRKKRSYENRKPKANSYLIVTEGICTEPSYFVGIEKAIKEKIGGALDVVQIDIRGEGCSTNKLIEKTEEIVSKAKILYQNVWIVFDKDDFDDFDEAIALGKRKGFHIAWSNQSFEYWIYLHFYYSDAALHRDMWVEKLNEIYRELQIGKGHYEKNEEHLYTLINIYGSTSDAIKRAKARMSDYDEKNCKPSTYDPGTTIHILVEELLEYLKDS